MALRGMQVVGSSKSLFEDLLLPLHPNRSETQLPSISSVDFLVLRFGDQGWYDICPAVTKLKKVILLPENQSELIASQTSSENTDSHSFSTDTHQSSSQSDFLTRLPAEILIKIILELDKKSLTYFRQTCKTLSSLLSDENLWGYLLKEKNVEVMIDGQMEETYNSSELNSSPESLQKAREKRIRQLKRVNVDEEGNSISVIKNYEQGYLEFLNRKELGPYFGSWLHFSHSRSIFSFLSRLLPDDEPRWLVLRNDQKRQISRQNQLNDLQNQYLRRQSPFFIDDQEEQLDHQQVHYTNNMNNDFTDIVYVHYIPRTVKNNPRVAYRSGSNIFQKQFETLIQKLNERTSTQISFNDEFIEIENLNELKLLLDKLYF